MTRGAISPLLAMTDDRGPADLEVHGGVPPLHKSQFEPGILDRDCVHHRARWTQPRNLDASRVTNAVMLLTSNSKQFRLSNSGGFQIDKDQFAS